MAKFVLSGRVDCPRYARAEMLAENLRAKLPHFNLNKIVLSQAEWPSWVQETCKNNNWSHPPSSSPLIWRELIERGGKGVYMGSLEDFMNYADHYYGIAPETTDVVDTKIANENLDAYNTLKLEEAQSKPADPLRVCITNASSHLAYHLSSRVVLNRVFGDQNIHLQLLDTTDSQETVQGLAMELQDLAHPNLSLVTCTDSVHEAFKAVSAVFVLDEFKMEMVEDEGVCNGEGAAKNYEQIFGTASIGESKAVEDKRDQTDDEKEHRVEEKNETLAIETQAEDKNEHQAVAKLELDPQPEKENKLLSIQGEDIGASGDSQAATKPSDNADMFVDVAQEAVIREAAIRYDLYGGILDYAAQKDVRVIIVGQLSNIGAAIMSRRVTSIDKRNFVSSSGLAEGQASSVLAGKLGVATADVQQVGIFGRSQGIVLPDASFVKVYHYQGSIVGPDSFSLGVKKCLFDYKWLKEDFPTAVLERHNKNGKNGERKAYLAEAVSLSKLMKDWWAGNDQAWHSVGMVHEDEDIAVSYPSTCKNGIWEKIEGAPLGDENAEKLVRVVDQLKKEYEKAMLYVDKVPESIPASGVATPTSKL